jgi:hypothetical protein
VDTVDKGRNRSSESQSSEKLFVSGLCSSEDEKEQPCKLQKIPKNPLFYPQVTKIFINIHRLSTPVNSGNGVKEATD